VVVGQGALGGICWRLEILDVSRELEPERIEIEMRVVRETS
jgi:hypothetical protein